MKKLLLLLLIVPVFGLAQNLPDYVPASGLAAFYTFDGNANDSSTNQNNGTVHGAVLSEDRNLNPNSSYFFDGQDDYIDMGLDSSLQIQNSFSASVWFKAMGGSCNPRIFESKDHSGGGGGYALALTTGTQLHVAAFGADGDDYGFAHIDNVFNQDTWTHIAFTVNGGSGEAKLYVNGQLFLSQTRDTPLTTEITYEGSLNVGNIDPTRCDWYRGNIDDLGIWNRILNSEEVLQLYNLQTASTNEYSNVISIYPNPTTSIVNLKGDKQYDIEVYNLQGKKVMALRGNTIDMSHLSSATYIVKALDKVENEEVSYKVVKN